MKFCRRWGNNCCFGGEGNIKVITYTKCIHVDVMLINKYKYNSSTLTVTITQYFIVINHWVYSHCQCT